MEEILDHAKTGFREAVHISPLAKEPAYGLKINLDNVTVHEDQCIGVQRRLSYDSAPHILRYLVE